MLPALHRLACRALALTRPGWVRRIPRAAPSLGLVAVLLLPGPRAPGAPPAALSPAALSPAALSPAALSFAALSFAASPAVGATAAATVTPTPTPPALPKATGTPRILPTARSAQLTPAGVIVADTGFRPGADGFGFPNYAAGYSDLTPATLQRLFGPAVCATLDGDRCLLSGPARLWLDRQNLAMAGGHCYGMAVLSQLFATGDATPQTFGAAVTSGLALAGNAALQREIAYTWSFQTLDALHAAAIKGTPNQVLTAAQRVLASTPGDSPAETYTLALVDRSGRSGHAVTPYAVADLGDGRFAIRVYDPNYPGQSRAVIIDRTANTWRYNAAPNPNRPTDKYTGDASTQSLWLLPNAAGLAVQPCPFCADTAAPSAPPGSPTLGASPALYLDGPAQAAAHLLITDSQGRRYGVVGDTLVTEIPGMRHRTWLDPGPPPVGPRSAGRDPVYYLPPGEELAVTLTNGDLVDPAPANVVVIGPGYALGALGVTVAPDEPPSLLYPAADGNALHFAGGPAQAPTIVAAFAGAAQPGSPDNSSALDSQGGPSYEFRFGGLQLAPGATFDLAVDSDAGTVQVTLDARAPSRYDLSILRIDDAGETIFYHPDVVLDEGSTVMLDYGAWAEDGDLSLSTDHDGDGAFEDEEMLPNEPPPDGFGTDEFGADGFDADDFSADEFGADEFGADEFGTGADATEATCDSNDPGCALEDDPATTESTSNTTDSDTTDSDTTDSDTTGIDTASDAPATVDSNAVTPDATSPAEEDPAPPEEDPALPEEESPAAPDDNGDDSGD